MPNRVTLKGQQRSKAQKRQSGTEREKLMQLKKVQENERQVNVKMFKNSKN